MFAIQLGQWPYQKIHRELRTRNGITLNVNEWSELTEIIAELDEMV